MPVTKKRKTQTQQSLEAIEEKKLHQKVKYVTDATKVDGAVEYKVNDLGVLSLGIPFKKRAYIWIINMFGFLWPELQTILVPKHNPKKVAKQGWVLISVSLENLYPIYTYKWELGDICIYSRDKYFIFVNTKTRLAISSLHSKTAAELTTIWKELNVKSPMIRDCIKYAIVHLFIA